MSDSPTSSQAPGHTVRWLAVVLALSMFNCSPELTGRTCSDDTECAAEEYCHLASQTCMVVQTSDTGDTSDAALTDSSVEGDISADAPVGDIPLEDRSDVSGDAQADISTGDSAGGDDLSDVADEDLVDAGQCQTQIEYRTLHLFEPCRLPNSAYPGESSRCRPNSPVSLALESGEIFGATSARVDEPFLLPLFAGIAHNPGYWAFENSLESLDGELLFAIGEMGPVFDTGRFGFGLSFSGAGAELAGEQLEQDTAFTVALFFKPVSFGDGPEQLIERSGTREGSLGISLSNTQLIVDIGGGTIDIELDPGFEVDRWYHVALVVFPDGGAFVYLDGVLLKVIQIETWAGVGVGAWYLARSQSGIPGAFSGVIDELLLQPNPLTDYELRAYLYAQQPFGTPLAPNAASDLRDIGVAMGSPDTELALIPFELAGARPVPDDDDQPYVWHFDGVVSERVDQIFTMTTGQIGPGRFGYQDDGSLALEGGQTLNFPDLEITGTGSIELWFRTTVFSQDVCVFCSDDELLKLVLNPEGGLKLTWCGDELVTEHLQLLGDHWHHVALLIDGLDLELIVDGWAVGSIRHDDPCPLEELTGYMVGSPTAGENFGIDELVIYEGDRDIVDIIDTIWPPLPSLRFMVGTGEEVDRENGPFYLYPELNLFWGAEPQERAGSCTEPRLLQCAGYLGWIPFEPHTPPHMPLDQSGIARGKLIFREPATGPTWTLGLDGAGRLFDQTEVLIEVPDLSLTDAYTVDFWVNTVDTGETLPIVSWGESRGEITLQSIGGILDITVGGVAREWDVGSLKTDQWNHVFINYDGVDLWAVSINDTSGEFELVAPEAPFTGVRFGDKVPTGAVAIDRLRIVAGPPPAPLVGAPAGFALEDIEGACLDP